MTIRYWAAMTTDRDDEIALMLDCVSCTAWASFAMYNKMMMVTVLAYQIIVCNVYFYIYDECYAATMNVSTS